MASTRLIFNAYSSKLDSMTEYIHNYLLNEPDLEKRARTFKSIDDFCYNNSGDFKRTFISKVGINDSNLLRLNISSSEEYKKFLNHLVNLEGECVFLLKDTHKLMVDYQKLTNKGYGLLINRDFLCSNDEEKYFFLIDLTYKILNKATNLNEFLKEYKENFNNTLLSDPSYYEKAYQIYEYVKAHYFGEKIVWVDFGFQFTFCLFCFASIEYFSKGKIRQDFYNFTTYTWLQEFFKEKYFSKNNEFALDLELDGIKFYYQNLLNKAQGSLVGFAIGDSLGFPVAGIEKNDAESQIKLPITSYKSNIRHPYFSFLKPGQYTDNTSMLMISTEHLIQNKGFNLSLYCKDLIKWYDSVSKSKWWRWPGPTAISAIKKLKDGFSPKNSGSTSTSSCSATYRVIPLGIFYKVFNGVKANDLKNIVINSSIITHNSKISTVGSLITAFIINNLISGVLPLKAVKSSLNYLKDDERDILLIGRINFVINNYEAISCDQARKELGTGSPIYQTLPLAIYYFLKYQNDFKTAVTSAANSLRVDSEKEKNRLKDYSWEEQLIIAEGGNSDGIAALTGAFSGLYLGINNIPREYLTLENIEILKHLSEELIKNKN